jgi:CRP-like cAMP-binding protein
MVGLVKRYAAGAVILAEGTAGGRLQIVHEGQVRISKVVPGVGEEALAILRPGDFFGEMEFLDGSPASAQAIAHSDCEIFSVPHDEVEHLMVSRPEQSAKLLWALARTPWPPAAGDEPEAGRAVRDLAGLLNRLTPDACGL